jgi:2-iminobutanoate/2-iminopropanoate deaminase
VSCKTKQLKLNQDTAPAKETVEVAKLTKFVNVEISIIAVKYIE